MRIVDYESGRCINDLEIILSRDEIDDLRAYLDRLSQLPDLSRIHLSELKGMRLEREITVALCSPAA